MRADQPGEVSVDVNQVAALRAHLSAHNGIRGLEVLKPSEVERAVRIFNRDGFVVVRDALTVEQLAFLRAGSDATVKEIIALDPDRAGNRGSHRYSFGGSTMTRSMLHLHEWQMHNTSRAFSSPTLPRNCVRANTLTPPR